MDCITHILCMVYVMNTLCRVLKVDIAHEPFIAILVCNMLYLFMNMYIKVGSYCIVYSVA